MKATSISAVLATAFLAGCCLLSSPYDYAENWLVREDATRQFAVPTDIIYMQGVLYTNVADVAKMSAYAQGEIGKGRFGGLARVFAPLVANAEDVEMALTWYLRHHHGRNRPFFFIGEGACGALLKQYEEQNEEDLRDEGFVASFYTEKSHEGFVTAEMVREIRHALARSRYREQWGREMPSGMLGK